MADDLPAVDSAPIAIPADILAALRAIPTDEEVAAAEKAISDWLDNENGGSEVPGDVRGKIAELQDRTNAGRHATQRLVALVDSTPQQSQAEKMVEASDNMSQLVEMIAGYRQKMIAQGFNETVAEQCALQVHSMMITMVVKGAHQ